jgi:hypothetical protein
MRVIYDTATRTFAFDDSASQSWGADIRAMLNRHGQTIPLAGVSFGLSVTVNGVEAATHQWPPEGVTLVSTDQDQIASYRVRWSPDDAVTVSVWLDSPVGRIEDSHSFTAPRPAQPYPSWTWADGQWTPPAAYPSDGADYEWSEDAQEWLAT